MHVLFFEERFFFTEKLVSIDRTKLLSGLLGEKEHLWSEVDFHIRHISCIFAYI